MIYLLQSKHRTNKPVRTDSCLFSKSDLKDPLRSQRRSKNIEDSFSTSMK